MLKRLSVILSLIVATLLFLAGCSKENHDSLAFVGDESDMKSCYDIYPEECFPSDVAIPIALRDGRFPPDIEGEYEMHGTFADGYYEYWDVSKNKYVPYPAGSYPLNKSMYIIIEGQVNGMAKIRFAFKKQNDYKVWYETEAYVYGNVYSEDYKNDFIICFENVEAAGNTDYYRGNILKGTISDSGILNIETWSVIKDKKPFAPVPRSLNVGGYEHYKADIANNNN